MEKAAKAPATPPHIAAGKFKAQCLQLIEQVHNSRTPIIVTKRGKPMVRLVPFASEAPPLYGALKEWGKAKGDIIAPIEVAWNAQL